MIDIELTIKIDCLYSVVAVLWGGWVTRVVSELSMLSTAQSRLGIVGAPAL